MRLRTQNILVITPIFVVLFILLGFLQYQSERRELLWGFRQQVSSLLVATSEFIGKKKIEYIYNTGDFESIREPLRKLEGWNQIKNLYIFSPEKLNDDALLVLLGEKEIKNIPEYDFYSDSKPNGNDFITTDLHSAKNSSLEVSAFLPYLGNGNKKIQYVLGVDIDASSYQSDMQSILRIIIIALVIAFITGMLVALFAGNVLADHLKRLKNSIQKVKQYPDKKAKRNVIEEIHDLDNILNTMNSILEGVVSRTHKDLFNVSRIRKLEDILIKYKEVTWKPVDISVGNIDIVLRYFGKEYNGDFQGIFPHNDKVYSICGSIKKTDSIDIEYYCINAFSCYHSIKNAITSDKKSIKDAILAISKLLPLESLHCVTFSSKQDKEQKNENRDISYVSYTNGKVKTENRILKKDSYFVVHTCPESADNIFQMFLQLFHTMPLSLILQDISKSLKQEHSGFLMLLKN